MKKSKWFLKWALFGLLFIVLFGAVTMLLWNWLVPVMFNGPTITFGQALGLLLLSKILFGGWGGGRWKSGNRSSWGQQYYAKWSSMSPEERERLKARMREKWCSPRDEREGSSNV